MKIPLVVRNQRRHVSPPPLGALLSRCSGWRVSLLLPRRLLRMLPSSAPRKLQLPTSEVVKIWKAQRGHRPPSLPLHCEDVARRPDVSECDKCLRINLELQRPMSAHFWLVDTHFPNISISSAPHPEKKTQTLPK